MPNRRFPLSICFLLFNLMVVLVALRWRYAADSLPFASPAAFSPLVWDCALAAGMICLLGAFPVTLLALLRINTRAFLYELLVFPALYAYVWSLPAFKPELGLTNYCCGAGLLGLIVVLSWRHRGDAVEAGLTFQYFLPALKLLAVPTAIMVALTVAVGAIVGFEVQLKQLATALAGYPFYACAQLFLFLVFLVWRLKQTGEHTWSIVATAAGLFGLIHWPNPTLMAATTIGGAVWTCTYLKRPNLFAAALSMGVTASVFINILPDHFTQNARCGPTYVQRRFDASLVPSPGVQTAEVPHAGPD